MLNINLSDTITAIATPVGESGIGIVRISGRKAISIAERIFISPGGGKPSGFKTFTTHYGWIINPQDKQAEIIDEVILTVMRKPRSYTREDIVEINCHGGIIPLRKILELVLHSGARLSKPGEFTQRAFLNGRIDLAQAEAVLDIIRSKTDSALRISIEQLKGALSKKLNQLRDKLLEMLATLEANIDFPDEDLQAVDSKNISFNLSQLDRELSLLLDNSKRGRVFREGIKVVICGKPNAGKSSLLNTLLKCERSIVTPIAGTTRDTIEDILDIRGIPVRIVDTAGIIEPRDLIEKKAVSRSQRYIQDADLVLLVFDGSRGLSYEDKILMRKTESKPTLALINKIDLKQRIKHAQIARRFKQPVRISAKSKKNIDLLEEEIAKFVFNGRIKSGEEIWISNLRHIEKLKKLKISIVRAKKSVHQNLPYELIAQDLKESVGFLDEILGRRFSEDLLDRIFGEFCIGK
ncbi:MAG: tRNA uridine-5-carboxymethylaminomethyl(34) synthesis GTPase MnmE [Candidatus Omnitrophota bacterium]|jgi:tRNA modification GTPase